MKRIAIAVIASVISSSSLFAATPFHNREVSQQKRIAQGIRSGELNVRETVRLENEERALAKERQLMKITGGGLSNAEKIALAQQQNRLSRQIYVQKHD